MYSIDWQTMWSSELSPLETVLRAAVVYVAGLILFRVAFTVDELQARLRRYGIERLEAVESAWLERDGNVTFVLRGGARPARTT